MILDYSKISFFLGKGYAILIIVAVALLVILVPYACGYDFDHVEHHRVNDAILSAHAQTSYGILLVSVIPSVIDTALDYDNFFNPMKWKKYIFGRVPIALTGLLVSLQFFVIADTTSIFGVTDCIAASYLISLSSLQIVFTGSMLIILISVKPCGYCARVATIISLFICSFIVIRTFTPGSSQTFHEFSNILSYIFLAFAVIAFLFCLYKLALIVRHMTVSDYICALYLLIYFVGIFSTFATFNPWLSGEGISDHDFSSIKAQELGTMNYCFSFMYIMLAIAPGRIARFEAVTHLVSHRHPLYVPSSSCLYVSICVLYSKTSSTPRRLMCGSLATSSARRSTQCSWACSSRSTRYRRTRRSRLKSSGGRRWWRLSRRAARHWTS